MTDTIANSTRVQVTDIKGTIRNLVRSSTITDETQNQAGLRSSDENYSVPRRLFFGEQTDPESRAAFADLRISGVTAEVEVSGYFKYIETAEGGLRLDDSALFVEQLKVIS